MKLISWQDIWITISEAEKLDEREAARVLLDAVLELAAFDDRGVWINDGSREESS